MDVSSQLRSEPFFLIADVDVLIQHPWFILWALIWAVLVLSQWGVTSKIEDWLILDRLNYLPNFDQRRSFFCLISRPKIQNTTQTNSCFLSEQIVLCLASFDLRNSFHNESYFHLPIERKHMDKMWIWLPRYNLKSLELTCIHRLKES